MFTSDHIYIIECQSIELKQKHIMLNLNVLSQYIYIVHSSSCLHVKLELVLEITVLNVSIFGYIVS